MDKKLYKLMNWPLIEEIEYSESEDPHRILGTQRAGTQTLVQAFFPGASEVYLHWIQKEKDKITGKTETLALDKKMEEADQDGFFATLIPARKIESYYYKVIRETQDGENSEEIVIDPYQFEPVITKEDTEKFKNGIHYTIYEKLGAHPMRIGEVDAFPAPAAPVPPWPSVPPGCRPSPAQGYWQSHSWRYIPWQGDPLAPLEKENTKKERCPLSIAPQVRTLLQSPLSPSKAPWFPPWQCTD